MSFLGDSTGAAWGQLGLSALPSEARAPGSRQNKIMWYLLNPWVVSGHEAVPTGPGQSLQVASQAPATPYQARSTRLGAMVKAAHRVHMGVGKMCPGRLAFVLVLAHHLEGTRR